MITGRTSYMRISNISCKYVSRESATQFVPWAPLNSSLSAITGRRMWDKAKTQTWEFAENLFTEKERSICLHTLSLRQESYFSASTDPGNALWVNTQFH